MKLKSCRSLWSSFSCEIVSYAFDRSMYIARVGFRFCTFLWILFSTVCSARVVLELGRKAYCVGDIRECSMRWFISCSLIAVGF